MFIYINRQREKENKEIKALYQIEKMTLKNLVVHCMMPSGPNMMYF